MKEVGQFMSPRWGKLLVLVGNYESDDGPLAVTLVSEHGEPIATLSVNLYEPVVGLTSRELPKDCFYAKQWSENEEISKEALATGLFKVRDDFPTAEYGFITAPVWQILCLPN